jgi:hypothetical protein
MDGIFDGYDLFPLWNSRGYTVVYFDIWYNWGNVSLSHIDKLHYRRELRKIKHKMPLYNLRYMEHKVREKTLGQHKHRIETPGDTYIQHKSKIGKNKKELKEERKHKRIHRREIKKKSKKKN